MGACLDFMGFPEHFILILRMRDVGFARQKKSLVLKLADVATNMRRLFGFHGGEARQGVLETEDADGSLGGDRDQQARATYKEAKKDGAGHKKRDGAQQNTSQRRQLLGTTRVKVAGRARSLSCRHVHNESTLSRPLY